MTVKAIEKSIRQLKPVDQIRIVDNILAGLHGANSAVERAWGSESDKRLTAYRKNKTSGVSLEVIKGRDPHNFAVFPDNDRHPKPSAFCDNFTDGRF